MGHDYLDLGDGHVHLNDFHIKTLGHLFAHCANAASPELLNTDAETLDALRSFFAGWDCIGPGVCVGTDFGDFTTTPDRYATLGCLFGQTIDYVSSFGDAIPLDYLDRHINTPAMHFTVAQPTAIYRNAIESLIALIPA